MRLKMLNLNTERDTNILYRTTLFCNNVPIISFRQRLDPTEVERFPRKDWILLHITTMAFDGVSTLYYAFFNMTSEETVLYKDEIGEDPLSKKVRLGDRFTFEIEEMKE